MKNFNEINKGIIEYNYSWIDYQVDHPRTQEEIEIDDFIDSWSNMGKPTEAFHKAIQSSYEALK